MIKIVIITLGYLHCATVVVDVAAMQAGAGFAGRLQGFKLDHRLGHGGSSLKLDFYPKKGFKLVFIKKKGKVLKEILLTKIKINDS